MVEGLDHVALTVSDLERSRRFYAEVVGLEVAYEEWHEPAFMLSGGGPGGGSGVALFSTESHPPSGEGPPGEIRVLHVAFRVDRTGFDAARASLPEHGIDVRFSDHGICHSLYFEDPDGHELEFTTYEL